MISSASMGDLVRKGRLSPSCRYGHMGHTPLCSWAAELNLTYETGRQLIVLWTFAGLG